MHKHLCRYMHWGCNTYPVLLVVPNIHPLYYAYFLYSSWAKNIPANLYYRFLLAQKNNISPNSYHNILSVHKTFHPIHIIAFFLCKELHFTQFIQQPFSSAKKKLNYTQFILQPFSSAKKKLNYTQFILQPFSSAKKKITFHPIHTSAFF